MSKYYAMNGQDSASRLVQGRFEVNKKYDIPQSDIDHFDLAIAFGLLANAPAAMFWVIYYLYSDPSLLSDIRQTIEELPKICEGLRTAMFKEDDLTKNTVTVDICEVTNSCPVLRSFINEVLRVQSTSASARIVVHDTILGGKYLLKKGGFTLVPSVVVHRNESAWGPTAAVFDAFRFMPQENKGATGDKGSKQSRIPMSANRSWGGGSNMCPGRYFAMRELLSILVITVLKYDISPVSGQWQVPKTKGHMSASIMEPVEDTEVWIRERKDRQGVTWEFAWEPRIPI